MCGTISSNSPAYGGKSGNVCANASVIATSACAANLVACRATFAGSLQRHRPGHLDAARRAEVVDDAVLATGRAGDADAAAVPDQQVRKESPVLARHEPLQVALDLDRVFLP